MRFRTRTTPLRNWFWKISRLIALTLKAAIRRLTCKIEFVPGSLRFCLQEKRRATFDRCGHRLSARPVGYSAGRKDSSPAPKTKSKSLRTTTRYFVRWPSNFGPILTRANWFSSAFIPASLKKGDTIYNPRTRKRERVSRLMVIQGSERKDIDAVYSGDIAALGRSAQHHDGRHAVQ